MATHASARSLWRFAAAYIVAVALIAAIALALGAAIAATPTRSFTGLFTDVHSIQVAPSNGGVGGRVAPPPPPPPHG